VDIVKLAMGQAKPEQAAERRTFRRFKLVSPVLFQRANPPGPYEIGYCTNVGLGGAFVMTTNCPATGIQVYLEVLVRAFEPAQAQLGLKCAGQVVRTQAWGQLGGFAVSGRFENQIARKPMQSRNSTARSCGPLRPSPEPVVEVVTQALTLKGR